MFQDNGIKDVWLTADELREERRWVEMSITQRQCELIRADWLKGKISTEQRDDAIDSVLYHDEADGKITDKERERLWKQYVS